MYNNYHVTMDSFGSDCPSNWEEIAAYLNDKIDYALSVYGPDVSDPDCYDALCSVWEAYCNGDYPDAPQAV